MVCIGIPVCRPLYKRWIDQLSTYRSNSGSGASGYRKQQQQGGDGSNKPSGPVYGLHTFGGSTMPGASQFRPETTEGETSSDTAGSDGGRKGGGGHHWLPRGGGGEGRLHKVGAMRGEVTTGGGGGKGNKEWDDGFGELRLGINGPFNEATAVGGADWNGSEEEILGGEFRPGGRGPGPKKRQRDLESGRNGRTGIQVTEEWRIDRPGALDR